MASKNESSIVFLDGSAWGSDVEDVRDDNDIP